jgi:hypothetical protein
MLLSAFQWLVEHEITKNFFTFSKAVVTALSKEASCTALRFKSCVLCNTNPADIVLPRCVCLPYLCTPPTVLELNELSL